MSSPRPNWLFLPALLAAALSLSACIGGSTPPSQFYMLEPMKMAGGGPAGASEKQAVALAPVRIPEYLDRPQIVTATAKNAYAVNELNRWAERLDDNIARVLAQNLSALTAAELVLPNASGRAAQQAKLRVSVNILEFHADPQGQAGLVAQWSITRGEAILVTRQTRYRELAPPKDYTAMVGALNECLNRLSRDLAEALRPLLE